MAVHTSNSIAYYLRISREHEALLSGIRHWPNLSIAFDGDDVWVKDLSFSQVDSVAVKSIPFKELYYLQGGQLFSKDSLLPTQRLPSLLWIPIARGLMVTLPPFNHNYFGLEKKVPVRLIAAAEVQDSYAQLVSLTMLDRYIQTASAIRLTPLSWILLDEQALILGTPLLPLNGTTYWRQDNFLFPSGYALEIPILFDHLQELIDEEKEHWVLWRTDVTYSKLPQSAFRPLTISSYRQSFP